MSWPVIYNNLLQIINGEKMHQKNADNYKYSESLVSGAIVTFVSKYLTFYLPNYDWLKNKLYFWETNGNSEWLDKRLMF